MYNYFPGAFCDLVWSDPEDVETWAISPRGAGWLFGAKVTHEFMLLNSLKLICRAHQLVHEGMYKLQYIFRNILHLIRITTMSTGSKGNIHVIEHSGPLFMIIH
jgi:hypothetical protein